MFDDILREGRLTDGIETIILKWNSRFRYDRYFRKKNNIRFNSEEHRALNQIDVFIDLFEDKFFENLTERRKKIEEGEKDYKKTGLFLNPSENDKEVDEAMFNNLFKQIKDQTWTTKNE